MRTIVAAMALAVAVGGVCLNTMAEEKAAPATAAAAGTAAAAPALTAEQQKVVAEIEKLEGRVEREGDDKPIIGINMRDSQGTTDDTLKMFKAFPAITNLDLANTKVTDAGVDTILEFKELTHLLLSDRPITDAAVAKLKALKKLTLLDISRTKATDKTVKELQAALPKCQIDWIFDHPEEESKEEKKEMK